MESHISSIYDDDNHIITHSVDGYDDDGAAVTVDNNNKADGVFKRVITPEESSDAIDVFGKALKRRTVFTIGHNMKHQIMTRILPTITGI